MDIKQERIKKREQWVKTMIASYSSESGRSICNTTIYDEMGRLPAEDPHLTKPTVMLVPMDTVSAVADFKRTHKKMAVLNFASYKNAGGRFMDGSMAQEEALCDESNLYCILHCFEESYYKVNREKLNRGLYTDKALYTPNVLFFKNGGQYRADVITCAAPNMAVGMRYNRFSYEENLEELKKRAKFVLDIASENKVDTLVLGAWGCGVFRQLPQDTATAFLGELTKGYRFKEVIFAVPQSNRANYETFKCCIDHYSKVPVDIRNCQKCKLRVN